MDGMFEKYAMSSEEAKNIIKGVTGLFIIMKASNGLDDLDGPIIDIINKLPTAAEYACDAIDLMDSQLKIEGGE